MRMNDRLWTLSTSARRRICCSNEHFVELGCLGAKLVLATLFEYWVTFVQKLQGSFGKDVLVAE